MIVISPKTLKIKSLSSYQATCISNTHGSVSFDDLLHFQDTQDLNTVEHNVITAELSDVLSEVRKINSNNNNAALLEKMLDLEGNVAALQSELSDYKLNAAISARGKKSVMTTYIRWGSKTCPGNGTESTYDGFAAGSHYNNYGGASNMLCLTRDPEFAQYDDTVASSGGQVYGTQYHDSLRNAAFQNYPYYAWRAVRCVRGQRSFCNDDDSRPANLLRGLDTRILGLSYVRQCSLTNTHWITTALTRTKIPCRQAPQMC